MVQKKSLRIASYNVHKCVGTDGKFAPDRIIAVLEEIKPDIVALQEADMRFGERAGLLNLDRVHDRLGMTAVPLEGAKKNHGWRGNVVLIRDAIIGNTHQIKLPGVEPRGAIIVDLDTAGLQLRLIATHFGLLRSSRAQQVGEILKAAQPQPHQCVVLMGDLNEWRRGKRSALAALEPIFGPTERFVLSYPSLYPVLALDRIFCAPSAMLSRLEVHDTKLARLASDHLPIKAELNAAI